MLLHAHSLFSCPFFHSQTEFILLLLSEHLFLQLVHLSWNHRFILCLIRCDFVVILASRFRFYKFIEFSCCFKIIYLSKLGLMLLFFFAFCVWAGCWKPSLLSIHLSSSINFLIFYAISQCRLYLLFRIKC